MEKKRVFFAFEIDAPWPGELPKGRLLDSTHCHMTLAFLGDTDWEALKKELKQFPAPPFKVGFAGYFDKCLLLPTKHPHVVAWHVNFFEDTWVISSYQNALLAWLSNLKLHPNEKHSFLPHVTLCRQPFNPRQWEKSFKPLPVMLKSLHLYESLGGLRYQPIWTYPLKPPFEEIEHTADIAFHIYGESLDQLFSHAFAALSFKCNALLNFFPNERKIGSIDDIVILLNELVAHADAQVGCSFKAISFHGELDQEDTLLKWEMIVDV